MKHYKAVVGPKNINVGKGDTQSAFNTFAEIINREAAAYPYELLYVDFRKGHVIYYLTELVCDFIYFGG